MINIYKYDEIDLGHKEAFTVKITHKKMKQFCELSGDINPLHNDEMYAKQQGYKDRVVYGMLISSYYSTLVGVFLPGERCLLQSVDISFVSPVYIGDTLTIEGCVVEKHDIFKQIVIKAMIRNQNNKKISKAKIKVGVLGE